MIGSKNLGGGTETDLWIRMQNNKRNKRSSLQLLERLIEMRRKSPDTENSTSS